MALEEKQEQGKVFLFARTLKLLREIMDLVISHVDLERSKHNIRT